MFVDVVGAARRACPPSGRSGIFIRLFVCLLVGLADRGVSVVHANDTPIITIHSKEVTESSGLAASNRAAGHFWTHNDSGDGPRLFAINTQGALTGSVVLEGAEAIDWEDIASYQDRGGKRLIVADVGDNQARRDSITLYLIDEPDPRQHTRSSDFHTLKLHYPRGTCDCEAIGVDVQRRLIWLVAKRLLPAVSVYSLPLPTVSAAHPVTTEPIMLTHRGTLAIPMVTAMDIDPRTGDVVLVNYVQCLRFGQRASDPIGAWILQVPQVTELPKLKQIEAVAVDRDGEIWITSEGTPGSLARLGLGKAANSEGRE